MKQLPAHKIASLRHAMKGARGVTLWRGASLYDGKPIKVLWRLDGNAKTGSMHTAYIVPDNERTYNENRRDGGDCSNCGDCDLLGRYDEKLGRVTDRLCYIAGTGLDTLHKSAARGNYPDILSISRMSGLDDRDIMPFLSGPNTPTRLGGWGDAAFVPPQVWKDAGIQDKRWLTNYTHQWRWLEIHRSGYNDHCDFMKQISMASCHSPKCVRDADKLGWRKFITVPTIDAVMEHVYPGQFIGQDYELIRKRMAGSLIKKTIQRLKTPDSFTPRLTLCPADKSHDRPMQCDYCPIMCDGRNESNRMHKADVWIHIHGAPSVIGAWKRSPHWQAWLQELTETRNRLKEEVA